MFERRMCCVELFERFLFQSGFGCGLSRGEEPGYLEARRNVRLSAVGQILEPDSELYTGQLLNDFNCRGAREFMIWKKLED